MATPKLFTSASLVQKHRLLNRFSNCHVCWRKSKTTSSVLTHEARFKADGADETNDRDRPVSTPPPPPPKTTQQPPLGRKFEPLDPDPYFDKIDLSFSNTRESFRSKSTFQLIRAVFVFKMCAIDFFVDNNKKLLKVGRTILGRRLFNKAMKATIYGQFVGGEDKTDIQETITKNMAFGVKSILDYSAEEDMSSAKAKKLEMDSISAGNSLSKSRKYDAKFVAHEEFGDRRENVISARSYFYESEMSCDKNMGIFMDCIDAVKGTTGGTGLAAVKLTALGRPQLLINLSQVLIQNKKFYDEQKRLLKKTEDVVFDELTDKSMKRKLEYSAVKFNQESRTEEGSDYIPVPAIQDEGITVVAVDEEGHRSKDLLSWKSLRDINASLAPLFTVTNPQTGELEQLAEGLNREEERQMKRMIQRINTLVEYAEDRNVRVMIDAEQTYFQPAISRLAVEMMKLFNKDKALVFNTYQCYLKDALETVKRDIRSAEKHNYYFACKLVRGAYMEQERKRAAKLGYDDPINPTYEATNAMYNSVFDHVLSRVPQRPIGQTSVMLATHNEDSVRFAVRKMHDMGLSPDDRVVCFGQLLGMCDQVSFSLGAAGYSVYKYVPYGPVDEVVPYLARRAQENRAVMKGANRERELLMKELKRRLAKGELFYKPTIVV